MSFDEYTIATDGRKSFITFGLWLKSRLYEKWKISILVKRETAMKIKKINYYNEWK